MFKTFLILILSVVSLNAQEIVKIPYHKVEGLTWVGDEINYQTEIPRIANISKPSIQIFKPKPEINTGTTVVILPGGGMTISSILTEGTMVADWLVKKGVTAVILKYRLRPTQKGKTFDEFKKLNRINKQDRQELHQKLFPASIDDALNAITYLRENANQLSINPNKIGVMGFSAGGAVTMGVGYSYTKNNRPNFLAPIYPWTSEYPVQEPKQDAPPLFIVCASNDPLKLAMGSINLYTSYKEQNKNAELHLYAKGKHGFGMKTQNLPSDTWIERFYDWAVSEQFITPIE
ncbi:alpha/beta hydrolase [Wenyingzhuangia aestuarii]|uniref:alpha/beta hydrolase n=1 Tax=Wenyingzhuangia aestuarii TaxID=1647582 RepID=UPI00143BB9E2|nr:alpha/beta hydrolase [Wenyingzhuangia aestuarii]NJB82534.1 acetyl esterase/lipase [Wenyingzhuangia aestuarii]